MHLLQGGFPYARHPTHSALTSTVTFLFTDIEGSTKRWEAHPHQMRSALARHDAILREAIEGQPRFDFIYGTVSGNGSSATIGVQRDTGSHYT